MKLDFKNNFRGYFQFYYSVIGKRLYYFIIINILVGLLDGLGLAMFIPLLSVSMKGGAAAGNSQLLGKLHYLTDGLGAMGLQLNLATVLLTLIVLFALKGLAKFFQTRSMADIRFIFLFRVRMHLLDYLQGLSYNGFLKADAGRVQNVMLTEVTRFYNTMTGYFSSVQYVAMLFTYVVLAFLANFQFAVFVVIGSLLTNFVYKAIFHKTEKASIELSKEGDYINSYLAQAVNHFKYLKATNYFTLYVQRLKRAINNAESLNLKMGKYSAIAEGLKEPIAVTVICVVIYIESYMLHGNISSTFVSLLLFYRALAQFGLLQSSWQSFMQNIGSMHSIAAIGQEMQEKQEASSPNIFKNKIETISLKNVCVSYPSRVVLENINLSISRNTTIAFAGESGAGKTSLANIVMGLFAPSEGEIQVNGIPLGEININSYRSKIGYISQDPVVFNDSIFNNVSFFDEPTEENKNRFRKAAAMASLTTFIHSLPEKENSILGDNGILISGGQKQRISIARELYKQCELLVLDEATSALDSETENIIQQSIAQLKGQCTIIIIAHRLSTIKNADTIYFLKDKTVSAKGTFNQLMESTEGFRKMVQAQLF